MKNLLIVLLALTPFAGQSQTKEAFLSDTSLVHASYSLYVAVAASGEAILDINSATSLVPASVMKLITSATALELLGPDYTFTTQIGYTGYISKSGRLKGDIIIKGGGDPALASPNFVQNYPDFPSGWVDKIKSLGIKKIIGRVITDDSYYDYLPIPPKWLWEDTGTYYGAGAYGASVFDNTYNIHFTTTSENATPVIKYVFPEQCRFELINYLVSAGTTDQGYVLAAPYSAGGWLTGSVPVNMDDFILSASIPDPPLLLSQIIDDAAREAGIKTGGAPSTVRIENSGPVNSYTRIAEYTSPTLSEIIEVLNHESVNLYAEHLVKELGKKFTGTGSTAAGLGIINNYLDSIGIRGMFISDGSGLSPVNSINAKGLAEVLMHMKNNGKYFEDYLNSLPDAGKEGTLKNWFKDEVFDNCLKAKSGSMTRVRCYAGYFTTKAGREMVFAFLTNDFSGPSRNIVTHYEHILKEIILNY